MKDNKREQKSLEEPPTTRLSYGSEITRVSLFTETNGRHFGIMHEHKVITPEETTTQLMAIKF